MLNRLLRRNSPTSAEDPGLSKVSQPFPPSDAPAPARKHTPPPDPFAGAEVTELSEQEARALCAREDIPVFWSRPYIRTRE